MVNPATYYLDTANGGRLINIEPVFEEIAGGDLFPTGRYIITDAGGATGEMRFDGDLAEWEWDGAGLEDNDLKRLAHFIQEYNEPELAGYLD
ncbi:MAG: hypothetical protein JSU01_10680 [Bacteroidetes bacterium]|nr:hypothetical protein [Bacteroidota bacterium]